MPARRRRYKYNFLYNQVIWLSAQKRTANPTLQQQGLPLGASPQTPSIKRFTAAGMFVQCQSRWGGYGPAGKQPERLGDASGIAAFTMPALRAAWARAFGLSPFSVMPEAYKREMPVSGAEPQGNWLCLAAICRYIFGRRAIKYLCHRMK